MAAPFFNSPFVLSNPLYRIATQQNFSGEEIQFKPIIDVLELLFGQVALGNFFINVIDFRDYTYPYNSPNVTRVVGYTKEQIGNIEWLMSNVHPDDLPVFMDYTVKVLGYVQALPLEQKQRAMINHCFRVLHGIRKEYVWLYQQHHMSYIDKNEALVYTISLVTDVTHLRGNASRPTWSVTERMDDSSMVVHVSSELGEENQKHITRRRFTPRETEIIKLAARGFQAKEIASALRLGYETVNTHRKNIMNKTGSKNMAEAVAFALNAGIL